jgi:EAL domain-containing protein (putative c-di-GMP-specific phosphodiesterase class I)
MTTLLYQLCRKKQAQSAALKTREKVEKSPLTPFVAKGQEVGNKPFTATKLAHIEHDLNKADLSRVLRRQSICVVTPEYDIRKIFDEYYINISHLRHMLHTEADFFSNPWLFKYLTQLLDDRMLDMLIMSPARYLDSPVSINFNVGSLLSKKFLEFDAIVKPAFKTSIVIEIQISDVFNDMSAFIAARNVLRNLGYKMCLDGLTSMNIIHIDRERLGFDLAKLQWNADLGVDLNKEENKPILQAVKNCGANRIILSRCDTRQAVSYGQVLGINLFQGRFLDRVLNPGQKIEN